MKYNADWPNVTVHSALKLMFNGVSAPGSSENDVTNILRCLTNGSTMLTIPLIVNANRVPYKINPCSYSFS